MRAYGLGILPDSQVFFHTPKDNDESLFLYPLCAGSYTCSGEYLVDRQSYDSFLLLYVAEGTGYFTLNETTHKLKPHDYVLIDCYRPHIYGSFSGCKILWVHFDGALARNYYDYIVAHNHGNLVTASDSAVALRYLNRLYQALANQEFLDSALYSKFLISILTEFMYHTHVSYEDKITNLEKARIFIIENQDKPITLEEMASQASLSVYYFTRCFKKNFGVSPYEYLTASRMKTACFFLASSTLSVKEIGYRCGFGNESNFCTAFKKRIGCTPAEYRGQHTSL